jgi:hypothetical protein
MSASGRDLAAATPVALNLSLRSPAPDDGVTPWGLRGVRTGQRDAAGVGAPGVERSRAYFEDVVGTLEANPCAAQDLLSESFSTVRLIPTNSAYRLELTMAEARGGASCGGPLFGLPRTTFHALVSSSRGSVTVRVLRPKRAA